MKTKTIKKLGLLLLMLFIMAQFFGPEKNQGDLTSIEPFFEETNPPEDVKLILKESCCDCHSNFTRYPWYNKVTPINYWLNGHIKNGKKHFSMSNWEGSSIKRKDHKFEELIKMVKENSMPLKSYTWINGDAKLNEGQIEAIINWAKLVRTTYAFAPQPE